MIFVTLGSQKFQFNRLLIYIDELIEEGIITGEVFAQIGYSNYMPKNFKHKNFLNREDFVECLEKSEVVLTHGGTGSIVTALKARKKVIAISRKSEFNEHVDNHQEQIIKRFETKNLLISVENKEELAQSFSKIVNAEIYKTNTKIILDSIEKFLLDSL